MLPAPQKNQRFPLYLKMFLIKNVIVVVSMPLKAIRTFLTIPKNLNFFDV